MTAISETCLDFDDTPMAEIEPALPPAEFHSFLEDYLASAAARLQRVETLHASGDLTGLRAEAHTLISTSGSYGFHRTSVLARQIETACKAGTTEAIQPLLSELTASSARAMTAMRARFLAGR